MVNGGLINRNCSQQSLSLPRHESMNSSPCESFCSIQIDGELSMIGEGSEYFNDDTLNGLPQSDIRVSSASPCNRRYT